MTLRQQNLDFLKANLFLDESACEASNNKSDVKGDDGEQSNYAKRKRREEEMTSKKHEAMKQEQVALLREFMTPNSNVGNDSVSSDAVNQSIIEKNKACVDDKKSNAILTEALTKTEKVNNLLKVMGNPTIFGMYDEAEQSEMKTELKRLISI